MIILVMPASFYKIQGTLQYDNLDRHLLYPLVTFILDHLPVFPH